MNQKEKLQLEAKETLRKYYIKPSINLIIHITNVSRSGMSRRMKVYTINKKSGGLNHLTYHIAHLLGYTFNSDDTITVKGCGMDMAFWLTDTISYYLFSEAERKKLKGNGGGCLNYTTIY